MTEALRDRLVRVTGRGLNSTVREDIRRIQEEGASLPVLDDQTSDELIGYDEHGLPA